MIIPPSEDGRRSRRATKAERGRVNYISQLDVSGAAGSDDEGDIDDWVSEIMQLTEKRKYVHSML